MSKITKLMVKYLWSLNRVSMLVVFLQSRSGRRKPFPIHHVGMKARAGLSLAVCGGKGWI
jgi:hypothetical protein